MTIQQAAVKFALVINGEVKGWIAQHPENVMQIAGLSSNPQVIETTEAGENQPDIGWIWDGSTFSAPE